VFQQDQSFSSGEISTYPLDHAPEAAYSGDTVVTLYRLESNKLQFVAENDDRPGSWYSTIQTSLTAGATYVVRVTGYSSQLVPFYGVAVKGR